MDLKQLIEKRGNVASEMTTLRDVINEEKRNFTPDETTKFEDLLKEYDSLSDEIEVLERINKIDADIRSRIGKETDIITPSAVICERDKELAFKGWVRSQVTGQVSSEERTAMDKIQLSQMAKELTVRMSDQAPRKLVEVRDLNTGTPTAGGFTVPVGFVQNLEEALLKYAPMRAVSDIMRTASGNELHWATSNDTNNMGSQVGEAQAVSTGPDPVFSEIVFGAYKYTSGIIKVSSELLEDSAFNLANYLGKAIGERLGRVQNLHCTTGNGSTMPQGIVTGATSVQSTTANGLTADDIIDFVYELEDSYVAGAVLMMNRKIMKQIRKFKDANGQYIWQPSLQAGEPETILGIPVIPNTDMDDSITTGNEVMVYGDLAKYKIREVNGIRLKRLVELYAQNDQEGFGGFIRFDGKVLDAGTHPIIKLTIS